jgi:predicted O-linked N-acetylglucosamine transferase (SPINDLY family)
MSEITALSEFKLGVEMLREARLDDAVVRFRAAVDLEKQNPYYLSFLGVAMARAERNWSSASKLCEMAVRMKHNEPQFYLHLSEVYTSAGRREEALMTLDRALSSVGPDARLQQARQKLGNRRTPTLPFLGRQNIVNVRLGILRNRIAAWRLSSPSRVRSTPERKLPGSVQSPI